jgi:hypothetical protein
MTPAQLEHLRAIDAYLDALLALAAKRTPGEWKAESEDGCWFVYKNGPTQGIACELNERNATYIAASAGRAEAGWRATKAAIADWLTLYNSTEGYADGAPDASTHDRLCNEVASICRINLGHILAAWPLELLTLP